MQLHKYRTIHVSDLTDPNFNLNCKDINGRVNSCYEELMYMKKYRGISLPERMLLDLSKRVVFVYNLTTNQLTSNYKSLPHKPHAKSIRTLLSK